MIFLKGGDTVERQKSELNKPIGSLIYRFVGISEHIKCHLGLSPCINKYNCLQVKNK